MFKKLFENRKEEFEFLNNWFDKFEHVLTSNKKEDFELVRENYLFDLEYVLNHTDNNKRLLKKLICINSDLVHHIQGFIILIKNQENVNLKNDMIDSFLEIFKNANLSLKESYES